MLSCDEAVLMKAVSHRPVIVAVDAYCDDFQVSGGNSSNHYYTNNDETKAPPSQPGI